VTSVRTAQLLTLLAATITTGLMAGVFGLYAHSIMPGLGETTDRTFVEAFQRIDTAIEQPRFMSVVGGALVFTGVAALLHLGDGARRVVPWVAAAFVLYVVAMAITGVVHVPRNHELRALGDPDGLTDLAAARARFDEARWIAWNLARAATTAMAFVLLAWALVVHGRTVTA